MRSSKILPKFLSAGVCKNGQFVDMKKIRGLINNDRYSPLPKSDTLARIASNAEIYDFELSDQQMSELDDLDQGKLGTVMRDNTECR